MIKCSFFLEIKLYNFINNFELVLICLLCLLGYSTGEYSFNQSAGAVVHTEFAALFACCNASTITSILNVLFASALVNDVGIVIALMNDIDCVAERVPL